MCKSVGERSTAHAAKFNARPCEMSLVNCAQSLPKQQTTWQCLQYMLPTRVYIASASQGCQQHVVIHTGSPRVMNRPPLLMPVTMT